MIGMYRIYNLVTWRGTKPQMLVEEARRSGVDVVFFGEVHAKSWMVSCVRDILRLIDDEESLGFLGLEMFNYRQQSLLDKWLEGKIGWGELLEHYSRGREGFPLEIYRPLMDEAKARGIKIVGVMPPREEAARIARSGLEAVESIADSPVGLGDVKIDYTGYRDRFMELIPREGPMAMLNPMKLLEAQAYKDTVMARITASSIDSYGRGIVLAGWAHVEYMGSAPTRLIEFRGDSSYMVVTSRDLGLAETIEEFRSLKNILASYIVLAGDKGS